MKIVLTLVCLGSFSLELVGMNTSVENASLETLDESALLVLSGKGNPMADYYLAGLYNDKNETAKAREFFRKAAPDIAEAYYMLGTLADEEGDSAAAENMYEMAAQKKVKEAEYEMGNIYLKRQNIKKAREFYEKSGAQDVLDALHNAATLCEEEGDYVKAAEYYAAAKKHYGQLAQEDDREAQVLYDQVIEQENLEKEARSKEGARLHAAGCFFLKRAYWGPNVHRAQYYLSLAVGKNYIPSHKYLGGIFEKQGLLDKAEECYTIAAKAEDHDAEYLLGKLIEVQNPQKARGLFKSAALNGHAEAQQKLTRIFKASRDARGIREVYLLIDNYFEDWRTALVRVFASMLPENPLTNSLSSETADIHYCLAQVYAMESSLESSKLAEANLKVAYYQKLDLKEKSLTSKGRATNSVGFSKRIEHVEAEVKAFKKKREELLSLTKKHYALAHKKHPEAKYQLFLLYLSEGNVDAAIELYKNEADSGDTCALTRMGEVAFAQGHQERAQALWEEAAKKGQKEARYNLAKHYTRLADHTVKVDGDRDAALAWLQKAEALFIEAAEYAEVAYELGKICSNQGNIGQAVLHFQNAAASGHIEAHCKLGLINKTKGNKTAALHHFGYAAAQGNKWALYHLGRYAQQDRNTEKALRYYRRATLAENDCAAYLLYELVKGDAETIGFISEMRFERSTSLAEVIEEGDGEAVRLYIKRFNTEQADLAWFDSLNDSYHDSEKSLRNALTKRDPMTEDISLHRAVRAFNLSALQVLLSPALVSIVQGQGKPYCSVKNIEGKSCFDLVQDFGYSDFAKVIRDSQQKKK